MGGFGSGMNVTKTVSPIIQNNNTPFPGIGNNITVSHDTSWYGTLRPRMGIAHRNVLVYGTVGMAFAHVSGSANTNFLPVGTEQYPAAFDETRIGWTAGGGVEVGFRKHWIVRGEFLLYDVDASPIKANPVPPLPPFGIDYGFINRVNVARFGVSYKF